MRKTAVIGYPRIGGKRELKKVSEEYFKGVASKDELKSKAKEIREKNWKLQKENGIDFITSNDFSFYDIFLDTAYALNAVPKRFRALGYDEIDTSFAMARGVQNDKYDLKALDMKKWFNTNYHYIVPEIEDDIEFKLNSKKIVNEYLEAKSLGIETKPVIIGALTFLKLAKIKSGKKYGDYIEEIVSVYIDMISELIKAGAEWIQIDEPILVTDLSLEDIDSFKKIYKLILSNKGKIKVLLQTYFGDVRDIYSEITEVDFDGVGLDFIEGIKNLELIKKQGFSQEKLLFAGIVNGKNIWKNSYEKSCKLINELREYIAEDKIVLNSSCSFLHIPCSLKYEVKLEERYKKHLAFAEEKLSELKELALISDENDLKNSNIYNENINLFEIKNSDNDFYFSDVRDRVEKLTEQDFKRNSIFNERIKKQREIFNFPTFPTTTIGSFPQTDEVRKARRGYKTGKIAGVEYEHFILSKINSVIKLQEEIGLDLLVHGEYERNDMVEYFGENLAGFIFSENGWVQSYGTRCVKPPVIFGDVKREKDITSKWINYAQLLTNKPVKGMLTGAVTIQNWSFPREDMSLKETVYQIALAIQDEVTGLEKSGVKIIQVDEAALREKLPIRKSEWKEYLDWAVKSFRLITSKVNDETQIHTHMCYSEFKDIIDEIKSMDADVITIESAKSDLTMLDVLAKNSYDKEIGPGVYDIHSPRVPSVEEMKEIIKRMAGIIPKENLWVNPDCGLKTRGDYETKLTLINMVKAAKEAREELK